MNNPLSTVRLAICWASFTLPWLTPYAAGPSSWVQPWLLSAGCAGLLLVVAPPGRLHWGVGAVLAATAAWGFARSGFAPETLALAASCGVIGASALVAAGGASSEDFMRALAWSFLAAALASTGIALAQYFGVAREVSWISPSAIGEAYANLRQRNQFATLTSLGLASLLWLARDAQLKWWPWAAGALLAAGNAATTSRTGLLQILVIGGMAVGWPGPRRDRAVLWGIILVAFGVAAIGLPALLQQVTGETGTRLWERVASVDACSSRRVLWSNVLHLVSLRPWLGWGWGELDYAHLMTLYDGPRFCDILDNAHNLPLHMAVELGLPFALAFCASLLAGLLVARPWRESEAGRQMAWAVLVAIGLHSLVEYPIWYGPFQLAAGAAVGLLAVGRGATRGEPGRGLRLAAPIFGAAAVVIVVYAHWDYFRMGQVYLAPEARAAKWREDPMAAARRSWLFRPQARFADLTTTDLTRANAAVIREQALQALHYSPEPRVITKAIESDVMLGKDEEAAMLMQRFRAAFPEDYAAWAKENHRAPGARASRAPG